MVCCSFQLVQLLHCVCMFQDEEKDKTANSTKELVRTINDRFKVRSVNCFCLLWICSFCAYLCKTSCYPLCNKVEVCVWGDTLELLCPGVLITWILYFIFFIDILIIISGLCVCICDFWFKSVFVSCFLGDLYFLLILETSSVVNTEVMLIVFFLFQGYAELEEEKKK